MKYTTKSIAAVRLPEGKADHIEWDDDLPGFGIPAGIAEIPLAKEGQSRITPASVCSHVVIGRGLKALAHHQGFKFQDTRCVDTRTEIGRH